MATATNSSELPTVTSGITGSQNTQAQQIQETNLTNPAANLPAGALQTYTPLQDSADQNLSQHDLGDNPTATQTNTGPSQAVGTTFDQAAAQYNANNIGQGAQGTAAQVDQSQIGTAQAAQGQVTDDMTVSGQYKKLTEGVDAGNIPDWAKGAVNASNEQMAARGLGASSIAAGATAGAILGAALPIATANAGAYLTMALKNLDNQQQANITNSNQKVSAALANLSAEQQTNMQNVQDRQAAMLSDQAAANAAAQFNATSQNQVTQFFANLTSQIATANAQRADAMSQFNAGQANAISQFNANLADSREKFNVQNQLAIDQSNVQWRRSINTTNTAGINAANQTNAQNMFNLSAQAQANLWQQWRDEASWANTASENALTRAHNLAVASLARNTSFDLNDQAETNRLLEFAGNFGLNLINNLTR
jgi:hypothetical protein